MWGWDLGCPEPDTGNGFEKNCLSLHPAYTAHSCTHDFRWRGPFIVHRSSTYRYSYDFATSSPDSRLLPKVTTYFDHHLANALNLNPSNACVIHLLMVIVNMDNCRYGILDVDEVKECALPNDVTSTLEKAYQLYDRNGEGLISEDACIEICQALLNRWVSRTEVAQMLDTDVRCVSFEQFVMIMTKLGCSTIIFDENAILSAFHIFDKENRGAICVGDLRSVQRMTQHRLKDYDMIEDDVLEYMISEFSSREKEQISFEDFRKIFKKEQDADLK